MTASIEFKSDHNTPALNGVKIITLNDGEGNTYTLDAAENDLKLKYKPCGQAEVEYRVNGLAAALKSLLGIKSGNYDGTGKEITVLEEKVAEKSIVEAILYAKGDDHNRISDNILVHTFARKDDVSNYINSKLGKKADKDELDKKADANNVYTKKEIDNKLEIKADADSVYTKKEIDNKLETKANTFGVYTKAEANEKFFPLAEHRALAQDILGKRIDGGSILVKVLGEFLDEEYAWYGDERNQTAKDFLAEKGEFTKTDSSSVKESLDEQDIQKPKEEDKVQGPTTGNGAPDVITQELITNKATQPEATLVTKVTDNKDSQEVLIGNQSAAITILEDDKGLQDTVQGNLGKDGISLSDDSKLSAGENRTLVHAIENDTTIDPTVQADII